MKTKLCPNCVLPSHVLLDVKLKVNMITAKMALIMYATLVLL